MSYPVDNHARTDDITDGISRLIIAGGMQKVTMRAIGEQVGISVGTLAGHLTNRERILRVCGWRFGRRRLDALAIKTLAIKTLASTTTASTTTGYGVSAFLPADETELVMERVWLAWHELARDDPALARTIARLDAEERFLLGRSFAATGGHPGEPGLGEPGLDALMAVVQGLRDAVCQHPDERMSLERAQIALAAAASAFARSSATILSGSSDE
jgi:AcrR family transcriptional regulator